MAVAAIAIDTLRPVPRNMGIQIPNLLAAARWIDAVALTGGSAKSYTLPTDPNAPKNKGKILAITATAGPLWFNFHATAVIPTGDVTDGSSPGLIHTDSGATALLVCPDTATVVSFICAANATVVIEVFA